MYIFNKAKLTSRSGAGTAEGGIMPEQKVPFLPHKLQIQQNLQFLEADYGHPLTMETETPSPMHSQDQGER
jgi:hypothetical protein